MDMSRMSVKRIALFVSVLCGIAAPAAAGDAAEGKVASRAVAPIGIPSAAALALDGSDADWKEIPVAVDGADATRPARKNPVLKLDSLKVARRESELWLLLTASEEIAPFVEKHGYADVCNVYFDIDLDDTTGSTSYHEKRCLGSERCLYVSLNPMPKHLRKGELEKVTCYAYMSVAAYDPALTARWRAAEKKRGKKLRFGNEFAAPAITSETRDEDACIAIGTKTFELKLPLDRLVPKRPATVRVHLVEHADVFAALLGSVVLKVK